MAFIVGPEAVSYADLQSRPYELQLKQLEIDTFGDFHSSSLVPFCSEPWGWKVRVKTHRCIAQWKLTLFEHKDIGKSVG